jgi:DNA modification methylase
MPPTPTPADTTSPRDRRQPGGSDRTGLGVFGANKNRPFHRWYPFVEGYSSELVERALNEPAPEGVVMDPFGGSGTTALAAATLGRDSVFAEVNPYLAWIADVKVNQSRQLASDGTAGELRAVAVEVFGTLPPVDENHALMVADRRRAFFPEDVAEQVVGILHLFDKALVGPAREIARLALATSLIPASNMVRRTDLRKRIPSDPVPVDLRSAVASRLTDFADDVDDHGGSIQGAARHIAGDVRDGWIEEPEVAVVVTSPPYLNGTNYCRNTKLELLALGFIATEHELKNLRLSMISAGINNVSKGRLVADRIDCVEPIAQQLDEVAYDVRIPTLVRTYFSDMRVALSKVREHAVTGARMYFDIGDSRYSGVHVPTHTLLRQIAEHEGWRFLNEEILRTRRSYDGSELTQVLMHFEAA